MSNPTSRADSIRLHPALYIGGKSLTALHHFYNGYNAAWYYRNPDNKPDEHPLIHIPRDFHDWVAYRTHHACSTSGWCDMILAATNSEEEAFDRFFCLLDEHGDRQEKIIAKIHEPESVMFSLNPAALEKIMNMSSEPELDLGSLDTLSQDVTLIPLPKLIRIVTYTNDPGFFVRYENEPADGPCSFRDSFHRSLSSMRDHKGGRLEVVDEEAYQNLLKQDEAWLSRP